jgi:SAM-dependent methyltransferase
VSSALEYPDFIARFYDTIYDQIRHDADHDFFLKKILQADGPVLEVGVGTGRFFIDALQKGADIYGIDVSPAMVQVLYQKLPENQHSRVSVQDVCTMRTDKKFNLIISPFRVFMHLLSIEQQLQALDSVYESLNPGGTFIFDLFVPDLKKLSDGIYNVKDFDGEYQLGKRLQRFTTMTADPINQISLVTFILVWQENGENISHSWTTKLRLYFRYEIEHLLARSKFTDYQIFGNFSEHLLSPDSKEFVIVCKR